MTDAVTVLKVLKPGGRATKRHRWNPTLAAWQTDQYDAGMQFSVGQVNVSGIGELGELIEQIRRDPLLMVIRGQLAPHVPRGVSVRRKFVADKNCPVPPILDVPRRWLMADIDGWPIPDGLDLADDIDVLIERAIAELLPGPFHDCVAFWQLSASSGFKPGFLSVHVWFWLGSPAETGSLRLWMKLNARVDLAVLNAVQAHYTADPIVEGGPDPIPRRTGWVQGEREFVTLPDLDPTQLAKQVNAQRQANAAASGLSGSQAHTVDGALAQMGDGDGLDGFHNPLLRAGMAYARATPPWERNPEAIKPRMRAAIHDAPKRLGRDVSRYLGDAYLDETLAGAFARVPVVGGWELCAPEHKLPSGDVEESRQRMGEAIKAFLATPMRDPSPLALTFDPNLKPTARRGLVVAEVGLGKSAAALTALAEFVASAKAAGRPHRVIYAVPEHRLGAEMVIRGNIAGIHTATWHGRQYVSDGVAMCEDLESVTLAQTVSVSVNKTVCGTAKGKNGRCEFFFACRYQKQRKPAAAADMVIVSHQMLFSKLPDELSDDLGLIVIDESFWQSGLRQTSISIATFAADPLEHRVLRRDGMKRQITDEARTNELHAIRAKLQPAFDASPDGYLSRTHVVAAGITADDCATAIKLEWKRRKDVLMAPRMPRADRKKANADAAVNAQIPRMAAFWAALRDMLNDGVEQTGRIELETQKKRDGDQRVAVLNIRKALPDAVLACPILMLDGTADIDIVRHFLPEVEMLAEERPAAGHVTVHQVVGALSKTSMGNRPSLVRELRDFVASKTDGQPALVITHLDLEPVFAGIPGVVVAHFGAISGRDEWRNVRHLFVIGRPQPGPADARALAAQLTGRPVPLENPDRARRGVLMADGTGVEIEVSRFQNPDLEMIRAGVTDAAIVQAAGRGRGVNRTAETPLDVWLMGKVIAPWPVADITRWTDAALSPVERMATRGVVLFSPSDAHRCYPDLFVTEMAARHAIGREGADFGAKPLLETLNKGMAPKSLTEVSYRPIGRGQQQRRALVAPDRLENFKQWLEEALKMTVNVTAPEETVATTADAPIQIDPATLYPVPALNQPDPIVDLVSVGGWTVERSHGPGSSAPRPWDLIEKPTGDATPLALAIYAALSTPPEWPDWLERIPPLAGPIGHIVQVF